jgi:EAL domain-containing protein (putative c-di-GMP-specific phosphodiesterase class I)
VETKEQQEKVREEGCTEMQGYYFSPPRPKVDIERLFLAPAQASAAASAA